MELTDVERGMLEGSAGPGVALAMRILAELGEQMGAESLQPISGAHIDACMYHGQAGLSAAAPCQSGILWLRLSSRGCAGTGRQA